MKYKNIKTGAVIETTTEVHGKDWQTLMPVKNSVPEAEEAEVAPVQQAEKKGGRKR